MPDLSVCMRVTHAFGLARKGSSLGILPLPLQTGHLANIAIFSTHLPLFLLGIAYLT